MDLRGSLDVLVSHEKGKASEKRSDPMATAIKNTQGRIEAAFSGVGKVRAKLRSS